MELIWLFWCNVVSIFNRKMCVFFKQSCSLKRVSLSQKYFFSCRFWSSLFPEISETQLLFACSQLHFPFVPLFKPWEGLDSFLTLSEQVSRFSFLSEQAAGHAPRAMLVNHVCKVRVKWLGVGNDRFAAIPLRHALIHSRVAH